MALSLRQKNALLKLGGAVGFLEEARTGKYGLPNYVLRALEIVEGLYDELISNLTKDELKELHSWMMKLQRQGKITPAEDNVYDQLISIMFNLYDVELVFKKIRRPIHYAFLVIFKFLKKKSKNPELREKIGNAIVNFSLANGYSLDYIEAKARAYAEKIKKEGI